MIRAVIFDMFETLITHYQSPLYFGSQMAADAGIPEERFLAIWRPTEHDRSIGRVTLEEVLEHILRENQCFSKKLLQRLVQKRTETKRECFRHLHPELIPMLSELRKRGILVGLISNCYSEEAVVIRESELFPYFDAVFLSVEQGVEKPDHEIFRRCMDKLSVKAEECLYVGDGGSFELETARELGMTAAQAVWYLQEKTTQPSGRKPDFSQLERPSDVLRRLDSSQQKHKEAL
ncbi:MAG: HAD family hydrolase [Lachnospiraceae bacterium]|nr:HAD family hydrolase [Lachnospiraceae bacterium]